MKKTLLFSLFLLFIIVLIKFDPGLSFTKTGGEDFESITPPVKSDLKMKDIIEWYDGMDKNPEIEENKLYKKVSGTNLHLKTWAADVDYYVGKELSKDLLMNDGFPEMIDPISYSANEEKIIAVKVTYLDLTNYGVESFKKVIINDKSLIMQEEIEGGTLFKYDDYNVFLQESELYYYLIE
jgi:hypothetical protein